MSRTRRQLLDELVALNGDLPSILSNLSEYPWDWDSTVLKIVKREDVVGICVQYLTGKITAYDIESWADAIEIRDDIGFQTEELKEIMHQLASPLLNERITVDFIKGLKTKI